MLYAEMGRLFHYAPAFRRSFGRRTGAELPAGNDNDEGKYHSDHHKADLRGHPFGDPFPDLTAGFKKFNKEEDGIV